MPQSQPRPIKECFVFIKKNTRHFLNGGIAIRQSALHYVKMRKQRTPLHMYGVNRVHPVQWFSMLLDLSVLINEAPCTVYEQGKI